MELAGGGGVDDTHPFCCHVHHLVGQALQCEPVLAAQCGELLEEVFVEHATHPFLFLEQVGEVEQFAQLLSEILFSELRQQLNAALRLLFLPCYVCVDTCVVDNGPLRDAAGQHQPFERFASAQGYVNLSGGKREAGIYDGALKGESLAFVNGDGPCQSQGILAERALHLGFNLLCFFVEHVFGVLPCHGLHFDVVVVVGTMHHHGISVQLLHMSYLSVII